MDLIIKHENKPVGRLKSGLFPVFQYFCQEIGYDVKRDSLKGQVQLSPILTQKKIVVTAMGNATFSSFRKKNLENLIINQIQIYLKTTGAQVLRGDQNRGEADFTLTLSLLEIPHIKKPRFEITHSGNANFKKLTNIIQSECKKVDMGVKRDVDSEIESSTINIQIISPVSSKNEFWNQYGEVYASIITFGVMAKLLEDAPLSVLSFVPVENLLTLFGTELQTNINTSTEFKKKSSEYPSESNAVHREKVREAESFFDYHVLIDNKNRKVQLLAGLHIKNIGTEVLRNPAICLKTNPKNNIKITGQILPKSYAQTKAVLNQEGIRGWRYMKDNWLEDFEGKGELWICPIHTLEILPQQTEILSNLQISFTDLEKETIQVEAFIFFSEEQLEFKSNNRISLSILKDSHEEIK